MRLIDRIRGNSYRDSYGYWEGLASGAAILVPYGDESGKKEGPVQNLIQESRQAYATNGIVFGLIMARLMLLAQASFVFRSKSDKSLSDLPPRAQILENPWPDGTTAELWARMEQDASTAGNGYYWGNEDQIVRLPPDEVTIVSEEVTAPGGGTYKRVIGYDYDPSKGMPGSGQSTSKEAQLFTVDEVAHFCPYPDPIARFRGMSWLTPVLRDVRADSGLTYYKQQYLDHGQPILAIKYPQKFRSDTIDSVVDRVMAKFGGLSNAFKPLVFDQGADPIIGGGLKDLDLAKIQAVGEERICAAAGVPPEILGVREIAPEAYGPAMRRFTDLAIRHMWMHGCAVLSKLVPVPSGSQLWYDTSDIAALQAAETEKAQVAQVSMAAIFTGVQAGFTRESVKAAVASNDMTLLVPDPNAPTPGVAERETINVADMGPPDTGPGSGANSNSTGVQKANGTQGVPPGGGTPLTKPQTPASKVPMPPSIPTTPTSNGQASRPSPNK